MSRVVRAAIDLLRMPWWCVLVALAGLLVAWYVMGAMDFYGPSVWIALPWDWSHNVQFGWSNGHWFADMNVI
jgi:hypothetical protein